MVDHLSGRNRQRCGHHPSNSPNRTGGLASVELRQLRQRGNAANDFDFDKDGLVNLIEFAFGLDPKSTAAHLLPQTQRVGNELVITFTPPPGASGVTYGAEASDTLAADDWEPVANTGTAPQRVFRVAIGPGNSKFMRLTVTDP